MVVESHLSLVPEHVSSSPQFSVSSSLGLEADLAESVEVLDGGDLSPVGNSPLTEEDVGSDLSSHVMSDSSNMSDVRSSGNSSSLVEDSVVSDLFVSDLLSESDASVVLLDVVSDSLVVDSVPSEEVSVSS